MATPKRMQGVPAGSSFGPCQPDIGEAAVSDYKFAEVRRSRIDWEAWYARSDDAEQDALLRDHCGRLRRVKARTLETLGVWPNEIRWVKVGDSCFELWTKGRP